MLKLDLFKVQLTADGFVVETDASEPSPLADGVHYRGIVEGADASLAAISVYDDAVAGFISTGTRIFNIGKLKGADDHVSYAVDELPSPSTLGCNIDELGEVTPSTTRQASAFVGNKFVTVSFEADFKMFQDHASSVTETTNYVTAMFNQIATLYANESIDIRIASVFVWTSTDPYASLTSTSAVLDAFQRTTGTNYSGNLAFFLTTRPLNGGIAYVDVICNKSFAFGMAAIFNSFANVPTYSWTVEATAHELGHLLGSPHTQSCSWQGGALDNCFTPEGSCAPGPTPTNGGTVMSYCHLTSVGINFNNGFGQQPGDLIRSRVLNASCLGTSTTTTTDTTAPAVSITTPAQTITAHTTLAIDTTVFDDTGVVKVELYKNGALFGTDTSSSFSFAWTTNNEASGAYTFTAKAFDAAGNNTVSSGVTMTLNVAAAVADTQAPTAPTNLFGTRKNRSVKLTWGASTDNVGVAAYVVLRNGVAIGTVTSTTATVSLVTGTNAFMVAARDAAGNTSAPSNTVTFTR